MTIGVALLGCGAVGAKRLRALPPDARPVAVFDIDRPRAEALAVGFPGCRVASSAKEALTTEGVELAIVATVHKDLAPLAFDAVDVGRHVLVEKPGACQPGELVDLRSLAAQRGLIVRVGFNHRFHPALLKARELIATTDMGPLMWIRGRYGHGGRVGYNTEWRADPAVAGGGELLDQGVHLIDLTRYLAGDADLVFAELTSAFWSLPVEDNAFLCLRVRDGGTAWLHASWTEWKNLFSLEISYQRIKLEITGLGGSYGPERLTLYEMRPEMGPPDTTAWEWPRPDESWGAELVDVIGTINGVPGQGATVDDAIAVLKIVEEAYRR